MDLSGGRRSGNVEDRRGARGPVAIGGGAVVVLMVVGALFGIDPRDTLNAINSAQSDSPTQAGAPAQPDEASDFVSAVLGSTEDAWRQVFSERNARYQDPKLVLFRGRVQSACGGASAAVGPFYCPADRKVYLDLSFFDQLSKRFGAPGDFAQAYVIAHEVGHHVQNLQGKMGREQGLSRAQQNAASVRIELQADCYAGVWAAVGQKQRKFLEPGDVEEALKAAAAIGDDTLQKQSQGTVVPESFTHGSSQQRVEWFKRGFDAGKPEACDTAAE